MRTSAPDIFAAGDAVETAHLLTGEPVLSMLAGPANREGRIAADTIAGREDVGGYRGTQGTAVVKVFEMTAGGTGLTETELRAAGMDYRKVYTHQNGHAAYYPGTAPLFLKVLFDPAGGKLLGAQVLGWDGVDKRIDILAVALRAGMTVFDLEHLELAYAPPYGAAKDPVNMAGQRGDGHGRGPFGVGRKAAGDAGLVMVLQETHQPGLVAQVRAQVVPDGGGVLAQDPVIEPLVVAEVEALLLKLPLHVPVGLGDHHRLRMPGAQLAEHGRPELLGRRHVCRLTQAGVRRSAAGPVCWPAQRSGSRRWGPSSMSGRSG